MSITDVENMEYFLNSCCLISAETNNGGNLHQVKHLPPILLNFELPSDYPSVSPPNFTLSCKWLTNKQVGCFINYYSKETNE